MGQGASSRVLRLEPLIIFRVSLFSRAPLAPPLPNAQEPAPPPSPCPAFSAPVPPRPTQVAAAGSGCRRLRFPRPPGSPVERAAVKGGVLRGGTHSSLSPQCIQKAGSGARGWGTVGGWGGPSGRVEKKNPETIERERDWINKIRCVCGEENLQDMLGSWVSPLASQGLTPTDPREPPQ